jgi:uncharacterized protein YcfJ
MNATLSLAVVLSLVTAAPLMAQDQSKPLQTSLRAAIVREGVRLAQTTPPPAPPAQQRSWRARHPAKFGAIVGAIAGSVVGSLILATNCHGGGEGVCSPNGAVVWTGMFAGMGAGSGAAIGALGGR